EAASARSDLFATPAEILQSMETVKVPEDKIVAYFNEESGEQRPLTKAGFKEVTGAEYCPQVFGCQNQHFSWWLKTERPARYFNPLLAPRFERFLKEPPYLSLQKEFSSDGKVSLGLGVCAARDIPAHSIIDLYGGVYTEDIEISPYRMSAVDALEKGTPIT